MNCPFKMENYALRKLQIPKRILTMFNCLFILDNYDGWRIIIYKNVQNYVYLTSRGRWVVK